MRMNTTSKILLVIISFSIVSTSVRSQQGTQDKAAKKTTGTLLRLLTNKPEISSTTTTSDSRSKVTPKDTEDALLPLKVSFSLRAGEPVPESIRKYLPAATQGMTDSMPVTRTFSVARADETVLEELVKQDAVIAIEIARPVIIGPEMDVHPRNLAARASHNVDEFNAEHSNITGQGLTGLIVDEGAILGSHVEFREKAQEPNPNRIEVKTKASVSEHSTHVAGTMAAFGRKLTAKGMAPGLKLVSEDWDADLTKLIALAPSIQISNHSYGPLSGWFKDRNSGKWYWWGDRTISKAEDAKFGKYGLNEAQLDELIFKFPHLLTFISAGNDRSDGPPQQPILHYVIEGKSWVLSDESHRPDGYDNGGLDTIAGLALAKNVICIGSIDDITASSPIVKMVSYSGWGPADDGRIKPDLVANGHHLLSTSGANDNSYVDMSGTSMASPTAAGIGALMVQLLQKERPELMSYSAAVIKAVLIHTATDDIEIAGPDPRFGWGSINALQAGRVISRKEGSSFKHFINIGEIGSGDKDYEFEATGDPIRVTLVWIDPQATANLRGLDDATPTLQNDLDVKLTDSNGQVFYPYRLDRASPLSQAKRDGPNRVDNVEVIDAIPSQGKWKVEVAATSIRQGSSQRFALVVSGLKH